MAPSVKKEIEILKTAIANQKLEELLLANKRTAKFISKKLGKPKKTTVTTSDSQTSAEEKQKLKQEKLETQKNLEEEKIELEKTLGKQRKKPQ
jgi:hypothetical protein